MRDKRRLTLAVVGLSLLTFAIQSGPAIWNESVTFDEPASIGSAYLAFRTGDLSLCYEKPPLLGLFLTLPLLLMVDPPIPEVENPGDRGSDLSFGDNFLHHNPADTLTILRISRVVILGLSLILGGAVCLWAFKMGGHGAAALASFLFAFSPNLLAHSRIAASDMLCTVFTFLSLLALYRFSQAGTTARAVLAGVLLGMALTSKLTAVFVLPTVFVVCGYLILDSEHARQRLSVVSSCLVLVFSAFLTLGAMMGGRFDYGLYFAAFGEVYALADPAYEFFLAGQFSRDPWWYYYLMAALIKTPIPFLLLIAGGTVGLWTERRGRWIDLQVLILPIITLVALSCFDRANIGLRRILPVYPLLIVVASQTARLSLPRAKLVGTLVVLGGWQVVSVLSVGSHHLSYFNEVVGGSKRGIYYLDDSNIDWGQDLPSLARWLDDNPAAYPRLSYFGKARTETYGISLPELGADEVCDPHPTMYAVSVHRLIDFERYSRRLGRDCGWLGRFSAVDRVAESIHIYDFRVDSQMSQR